MSEAPWKQAESELRSPSVNQIYYSWPMVGELIKLLGDRLAKDMDKFEVIAGIERGGLIPAVALSNRFNKPLIVIPKDDFEAIELPRSILIVDDVMDTGHTMYYIEGELLNHDIDYQLATLVKKPWASKNIIGVMTTENWVVWPWEI